MYHKPPKLSEKKFHGLLDSIQVLGKLSWPLLQLCGKSIAQLNIPWENFGSSLKIRENRKNFSPA